MNIKAPEIILPKVVNGVISPYPTVVTVTKAHQTPSPNVVTSGSAI